MSKIIVHIGLPKTATTTLQKEFFPNLDSEEILYAGIYQPRSVNQRNLYKELYKTIITGVGIKKVQGLIEKVFKEGRDVLISEESIVVSEKAANWREKISNLYKILQPFEHQLLVSVREPVSASFSYYVELYHNFRKLNKNFVDLVLQEESMEIFHYKTFFTYLFQYFNEQDITVLKFEDIITNSTIEAIDIDNFDYSIARNVKIKKHNAKKAGSGVVYQEHSSKIPLLKNFKNVFQKLGLFELIEGSFFEKTLKKFYNKFYSVEVNRQFKVEKPDEDKFIVLRNALKEETQYLKRNFNIVY
ncbi:hypothetical protein [Maribellus mangrovi]|uniref:hypothetical protein n=1 Tax=Maribellus mangrovi TaxID=3133146 RepID=UPI0030EEEF51